MENHMIDPPDTPFDVYQPEEEEPETMPTPRDSYEISGPFQHIKGWSYQIMDHFGEIMAVVANGDGKLALENALLLAAAPRMFDVLADLPGAGPVAEATYEATGANCEACDTLGQPSRMVMSPDNRLYHEVCVPEDVKKAIAKEQQAADADDDVAF